ncbi:hypothetical protein PAMP_009779 [Pampus punctatissimus]
MVLVELDNILANDNTLLIILDGFDEFRHYRSCDVDVFVTEPDEDAGVVEVFGSLMQGELLPNASVMLTSRPAAISHIPVGCIECFVLITGFSLAEVQDFFLRYFQYNALADQMFAVVVANELMLTLCYIPAFCYIICCILKETQRPKTMTDIYVQYLLTLLHSHTQARAETFHQEQRAGAVHQLSDVVLKMGQLAFKKLTEHQTLFYSSDRDVAALEGCSLVQMEGNRMSYRGLLSLSDLTPNPLKNVVAIWNDLDTETQSLCAVYIQERITVSFTDNMWEA